MEPPGGNGHDELKGTIAGHQFALNTRDLVSVLLLVGVFVQGYLVWQGQRAAMRLLYDGQQVITTRLAQQDAELREQTSHMIRLFYAIDFNMGKPQAERIPLHLYEPGTMSRSRPSVEGP